MLDKIFLLNVWITNASKKEVLEYIEDFLKKKEEKFYIVTPNPELIMISQKNPSYKNILNGAKLALCDGVGLMIASKFLGKPIKERITGVDFVESVCSWVAKKPITVGLLGGGPGVAENVRDCLRLKYADLKVVFAESGNPDSQTVQEMKFKIKDLRLMSNSEKTKDNRSYIINYIDILFVAFGSPKQEEWIAQNLKNLPVRIVVGVGGAFDFIAGKVPRAPKLMQSLGLEWLFRLIIQPWRIKRQLALGEFIKMVLEEKFHLNSK